VAALAAVCPLHFTVVAS